MSLHRRDFVKSGAAALALGLPARRLVPPPAPDPSTRDLCLHALDAARSAGAAYADIRVSRKRNQSVGTREQQVTWVNESETEGFGIRVLVGGAWGFAASRELNRDEVSRIARVAVAQARAIVAELKKYDAGLHDKPRWIVLNKIDMVPAEERAKRVKDFIRRFRWKGPVFEISALTREGCEALTRAVYQHVAAMRNPPADLPDPRFPAADDRPNSEAEHD